MDFTIKLADKIIGIKSRYPELKTFCKDYLTEDKTPDFFVSWSDEDIRAEQNETMETCYSLNYLETLAALRKISEKLPLHDRLLVHGAAISFRNEAYLFTAPSGTGKTTHIKLWKKYLKDEVDIVNGDKPILSIEKHPDHENVQARIYGTPWAGKENWQKNRSAALYGICFINQSRENSIRQLMPENCLEMLIRQVYIPADPAAAGLTLELLDRLVQNVPLYLLNCDMSESAVKCSFEALTGLPYSNSF